MGAGAVALAAIVVVGRVIASSAGWTATEMTALRAINQLHTSTLDSLALGVNFLFSPVMNVIILAVVALVILGLTKRIGVALQFAVVVGGSWIGTEVIKVLVDRARPDHLQLAHAILIDSSPSYPSGHTAFVAALAMGFIVLARGHRFRGWVITAGALVAVLVALSRVYLGVHYVTDVTASIVYSVIAVSVLTAVWNRYLAQYFRSA